MKLIYPTQTNPSFSGDYPSFVAQEGEEVTLPCPVNVPGKYVVQHYSKNILMSIKIFSVWGVSLVEMVQKQSPCLRLQSIRTVQQCGEFSDGQVRIQNIHFSSSFF